MNNKQLFTYLLSKKIYIISPHFDDAILSAGMLMTALQGKADITVINVFTKAHEGPYTLSAKQFLKAAGYTDAVKMYKERREHDNTALALVGAKHVDLNFTDALFRKKKHRSFAGKFMAEFDHVYPTYRWHILKFNVSKDQILRDLETKLRRILPEDALVIAPFGIGNHADHVLTRKAVENITGNIAYYVDFPYNLRLHTEGKAPEGFGLVSFPVDLNLKTQLIAAYESQVDGLFPRGIIPKHKELFYIGRNK